MNNPCCNNTPAPIWPPALVGSLLLLDMFLHVLPAVTTPLGRLINFVIGIICFATLRYAGRDIYHRAWQNLLEYRATMDTLVTLSTASAWLYSMFIVLAFDSLPNLAPQVYFESAVVILALVNLGHYCEFLAKTRSEKQIKYLLTLQPSYTATSQIKPGDSLQIKPGERIPVDGILLEGQAYINEAMLNGEANPVYKNPGDKIFAGTLNTTGSFKLKAEQIGSATLLAHIIQQVEHALNTRPAISQLVDNISYYFVPMVIIIATITAISWYPMGPSFMLSTAMSVLIIACPCALGLATPLSLMHGINQAVNHGMLIRDGNALQTAGKITSFVFDKTGTLTLGQPQITQVITRSDINETDLLTWVASVEQYSEHPMGSAIVDYAEKLKITQKPTTLFQSVLGLGVRAKVENQWVIIGNQRLMTENHLDFTKLLEKNTLTEGTRVFIGYANKPAGILVITDPIRPNAQASLEKLRQYHINLIMATGDNQKTAQATAIQLGIPEVLAEVFPHEKLAKVKTLQKQGYIVGMVGDGINDAPALAQADISFTFGTGTDVAIETADITILKNDISKIPELINLSQRVTRNIQQNLAGAFIYNLIGIPIAAGVLYPHYGILLNPMIAAVAMALSSLTVILNANRLRKS